MPYERQTWIDHQEDPITGDVLVEGTPMDKAHLEHMEDGILAADTAAAQALLVAGGKAPQSHTHDDRYYTEAETQALLAGKAETGHSHTPASIGAAAASHTHTPAEAGAAPASHTHPAAQVTAGTLPTGVLATNSTDYTTSRLRNSRFGTAAPGSLANGEIFFVYE